MNILAIGDVVGSVGCAFLRERLPVIKKQYGVDVVIANGENISSQRGIIAFAEGKAMNYMTGMKHCCVRPTIQQTLRREEECVSMTWGADKLR